MEFIFIQNMEHSIICKIDCELMQTPASLAIAAQECKQKTGLH